jgi:hypothetical protein
MSTQIHPMLGMLGALLLLGSSCEKALLAPDPPADPVIVFQHLWQDVHDRYSYFDEKGIHWDSLGQIYRQRLHPEMRREDLFDLLAEMLFHLEDGHVNLLSDFDRSRHWEWYLNFPPNYDAHLVETHYLGKDYRIIGPMRTRLLDSVLYLDYRSFTQTVTDGHIRAMLDLAQGARGVIVDIRHNGGGNLGNALRLSAAFCDTQVTYARERIKTGPGRDQFSAWYPLQVRPRAGERFTGKVAVLTNRRTYSAANFFAQMARALPNARLFGDQTGGGGGIPVFGELPNGWTYRFSASQAVDPDGRHLEFGVPVDVPVALDTALARDGVDSIIEAALDWMRG